MKAGIIFTGTGPILILTTYDSLSDKKFCEKMCAKGINKFIAVEVPVELCKKKYGNHFQVVMDDIKQENDLRVLDYNGFNVFYNFPFNTWGEEFKYESYE